MFSPSTEPTVRPVDPEFAPGHEVKFADGFPILVARQVPSYSGY